MSAAAAIIARRRREAVARFIAAGALTPQSARSFEDLGIQRRWYIEKLAKHGVLIPVGADRYYVDPQAWEAYRAAKRKRAVVIVAVLIVVLVIVIGLGKQIG